MKPIRLVQCLALVLTCSSPAFSARQLRVVVSELDANGVPQRVARVVSDHLRVKLIETRRFAVPEREKMEEILDEQAVGMHLGECFSQECAIEMGRLLQANKMVVGTVSLLNRTYSITVRFLDLETGTAEFSAEEKCQTEDDLFVAAERLAARIVAFVPPRGEVTAVSGEDIIVDVGTQQGVSVGSRVRILRSVERVPGYPEEIEIGTGRLVAAQQEWSRVALEPENPGSRRLRYPDVSVGDRVVGEQTVVVDEVPQYAFLMVFSRPVGAEVYVDNLFQGRTVEDGLEVRVRPGEHEVRVSAPAHRDETRTVDLRPNQRVPFNATLEPKLPSRVFVMPITTFSYARATPHNEAFRAQLDGNALQGMQIGLGRVYSVLLTEMGGRWLFANTAPGQGFGLNEMHHISGYGHAGLAFRFTGLVPYAAVGYDYGQLYLNENDVFKGNRIGSAGHIEQKGWYYTFGVFVRKWLHASMTRTWGHDHTDYTLINVGINFSAF